MQSASGWQRLVNPDKLGVNAWKAQHKMRTERLAELEHTAKVSIFARERRL